jgi:electron transport complex protein RnfC
MSGLLSFGTPSFRHGVHPTEHKEATERLAIEQMPFVGEYVLPLSQHIGAPSTPIVEAGDRVQRGQRIADPGGFVSTALHAPVTGTVSAVELRLAPNGKMTPSIVIEADPYSSQRIPELPPVDPAELSPEEMVERVQAGGLVGLGGAAFPSHVKFNRDQVRAERAYIGVEENKPDAIAALRAATSDIEVVALKVKYPQGAEKMLIDSLLGERVPAGGLPLDIEILVNNAGTTVALADLFDRGIPLIERIVTVTGPGIARPRNLRVPLGTPVSAVVEHCGGLLPGAREVVFGGPMMGMAQKSLEVPILKGTSGILCLDRAAAVPYREFPCIRCGRCIDACPLFLNPQRLAQLARAERVEELESHYLMSCFECAACSFACPSRIPLVQWMRMGKVMLKSHKESA